MVYRMAILSAALMSGIGFTTSAYANASAIVPFVGCKSDGQVGPQDAPTGKPQIITISPQLAQTVAYYKAQEKRVEQRIERSQVAHPKFLKSIHAQRIAPATS